MEVVVYVVVDFGGGVIGAVVALHIEVVLC